MPMFEIDLVVTSEWFSLFDEVIYPLKGGFSAGTIFTLLGGIDLIAVTVMLFVFVVKSILSMADSDSFALQCYDDLKKRNSLDVTMKKARSAVYGQMSMFISGVVFIIMGIVFNKVYGGMSDGEKNIAGYFGLCTGVNGLIAFAIITILGYIGLTIAANTVYGKIRIEIIKKEYDVAEEKKPDENNESSAAVKTE